MMFKKKSNMHFTHLPLEHFLIYHRLIVFLFILHENRRSITVSYREFDISEIFIVYQLPINLFFRQLDCIMEKIVSILPANFTICRKTFHR